MFQSVFVLWPHRLLFLLHQLQPTSGRESIIILWWELWECNNSFNNNSFSNSSFSFRLKIPKVIIIASIIAKSKAHRFPFPVSQLFVVTLPPRLPQPLQPILQSIILIIMVIIIKKIKRESLSLWTSNLRAKCRCHKSRFVKSLSALPGRASVFGPTPLELPLLLTTLFAIEPMRAMFEHGWSSEH